MPHIVIDYTKGLEDAADLQALCEGIREVLAVDASIPRPENIRVRARAQDFAASGLEDQSYAHADFFMLEGRDDETKAHMCGLVLAELQKHLPTAASLSVYPYDIPKNGTAKRIKDTA